MRSWRRAVLVLVALVLPVLVAVAGQVLVDRDEPPRVPVEVRVGVSRPATTSTPGTPGRLPPPPPVGDDDEDDDD
ncbi:hypothetical protein [Streptoalloteichus tenebrarius]|nr:hypothetical protein [Streptoalloteichus tenebrarius]